MKKVITVAAAIILNEQNQLLLVRKKKTACFMQVGGKLEANEAPEKTIVREIEEEIGCSVHVEQFIGRYETATANEPDHQLESYLYLVHLNGSPKIAAEIEEMQWISLDQQDIPVAPLTLEIVVPWCKQYLNV